MTDIVPNVEQEYLERSFITVIISNFVIEKSAFLVLVVILLAIQIIGKTKRTDKIMIKIENTETFGWEAAIRGMRNPMNSWDKSDSYPAVDCGKCGKIEREGTCKKEDRDCTGFECYEIGPNDLDLMKRLRDAGTDHRKFMRMITVYVDITAPLYWWKEFDTYKVGTVANSCSTMHKIAAKEFTMDDFSCEHLHKRSNMLFSEVIDLLNYWRDIYLDGGMVDNYDGTTRIYGKKDKDAWWQMIQLLPSSYNQKRTVMLNYEVLANIYKSRRNHKLVEWHVLCDWVEKLPYSELIIGGDPKTNFEDLAGLQNFEATSFIPSSHINDTHINS